MSSRHAGVRMQDANSSPEPTGVFVVSRGDVRQSSITGSGRSTSDRQRAQGKLESTGKSGRVHVYSGMICRRFLWDWRSSFVNGGEGGESTSLKYGKGFTRSVNCCAYLTRRGARKLDDQRKVRHDSQTMLIAYGQRSAINRRVALCSRSQGLLTLLQDANKS